MTISKDEFRSRFATEQGRLGLGYPHVDAAQASAVLASDAMLDATYDGWVQAQRSQPEQPRYGADQQYGAEQQYAADQQYGDQPQYDQQPYGEQQPPQYGERAPQYGERAPQYGDPQPPQYGQQPPAEGQYGQPYGQQPAAGGQYGQPYGQQPPAGNGSYFQQPNGPYGQQSPYGQQYGSRYRPQAPSPTSALVLAIIGIIAPFLLFELHVVGTIGLFLGIAALRRALVLRQTTPVGAPGRAVATTAFVLSIVAIVVGGLSLLRFLVALA